MFKINGFWLKQRTNEDAPKIFVASVKVKELFKYSTVDLITEDMSGIQRVLIPARARKITKFFDDTKNEKNIVPNSITISIEKEPSSESTETELIFESDEKDEFIKIIDGQHRIAGMNKSNEDLTILITAFINPSPEEKAFQFIVINNKSHKVPTLHVKSLISNFNTIEEDLQTRLNNVGISFSHIKDVDLVDKEDESPLRGFVQWTGNDNGIIPLTSLETSFKYIQDRIVEAKDDDSLKRGILYQIWNGVQEVYPTLWKTDLKINHLFDKSVFIILTTMLIDDAFSYCDKKREFTGENVTIFDDNIFSDSAKVFLRNFPDSFWTTEWSKKGLDTSAGKNLIYKGIQ